MDNPREKCAWYRPSRNDDKARKQLEERFGREGVSSYELTGCLNCDGYNIFCQYYFGEEKIR